MKNKFNFLQVANWLYVCIENLKKLNKISNKKDIKEKIDIEKNKIFILIEVLKKQKQLNGINSSFLKSLNQIKKQYDIDD